MLAQNFKRVRVKFADGWIVTFDSVADQGLVRCHWVQPCENREVADTLAARWRNLLRRGTPYTVAALADSVQVAFTDDPQADPLVWHLPPDTSIGDAHYMARAILG